MLLQDLSKPKVQRLAVPALVALCKTGRKEFEQSIPSYFSMISGTGASAASWRWPFVGVDCCLRRASFVLATDALEVVECCPRRARLLSLVRVCLFPPCA